MLIGTLPSLGDFKAVGFFFRVIVSADSDSAPFTARVSRQWCSRPIGYCLLRFPSLLLLLTILLLTPTGFSAEIRSWTDTTGTHTREASFQRLEADAVILKTKDGKLLRIPLDRLSATDQDYARKAAGSRNGQDPFESLETMEPSHRGPSAENPGAGAVRVVIAKGVGLSVEEAKKDAYREAVRQVVGAYVEGDTLIRNDEVIEEKVLALSGGLIQRADVIPESVNINAGLTQLRIRAEVRVTEVMNSLAGVNITTTGVRSSSIEGRAITLADQTESAEVALGDPKAWEVVPASFFSMTLVGDLPPPMEPVSITRCALPRDRPCPLAEA